MIRIRTAALSLLTIVLLAVPILAQQSTDGPFVLHEYLEYAKPSGERTKPAPTSGRDRAPGTPPPLSMEAQDNEPILAPDGPRFDQKVSPPYGDLSPFGSANTLDGRTDRVSSLNYFSQFEPTIIPYKRVVSQNQIQKSGTDYSLRIDPQGYRNVQLEDARAGEDQFWASFLIQGQRSRLHPIPSVSPEQRVVEIQTEPISDVTVVRDSADNFFLRIDADGLVRVNMRLSVPTYYFNGPFDPVGWSEFERDRIPEISSDVSYSASEVAKEIGATKDQAPEIVLRTMVEHFRDFEARPLTSEELNSDLYQTLTQKRVGVCRHRSLAFVITAQVLGIPARYVYNEAHAFVEVHWPGSGWRRVDLGGAADELNAPIDDGRSVHEAGPDPLPTPQRYVEEQQRMQQNFPTNSENTDRQGDSNAASESGHGTNNAVTSEQGGAKQGPHGDHNAPDSVVDSRMPTQISIDPTSTEAHRGDRISVTAILGDESGAPIGSRRVSAFIGPVGRTSRGGAASVGSAKTDTRGRARITIQIPRDHAIGRWELFVYFDGDETYQPAVGR